MPFTALTVFCLYWQRPLLRYAGLIFEKAYSEKRILLTFDLDFGEIVALSGENQVSVILFRLRNTRTPLLKDILATLPSLWYLSDYGTAI
jgi:hypothetical protein